MNRRHLSLVFFFLLMCLPLGIAIYVGAGSQDMPQSVESVNELQESRFTELQFFQLEEAGPKSSLYADRAILQEGTGYYKFFFPRGQIYQRSGEGPAMLEKIKDYEGDIGHFWKEKQIIELEKNVIVRDGVGHISSEWGRYELEKDYVYAKGKVKSWRLNPEKGDQHFIDSEELHSWPQKEFSIYEGNVQGKIVPMERYRPSTFYVADRLEARMLEHRIELKGNVSLKQKQMHAEAVRGELHLIGKKNQLERFFLYENVRLQEKMVDGSIRKAFGEQLEGVVNRREYILTGYPRVYQSGDIIKGTKIVLFENSDLVEVDSAQTDFIVR